MMRYRGALVLILIALRLIFSPEALSQYFLQCHNGEKPLSTRTVTLWYYPLLTPGGSPLCLTEILSRCVPLTQPECAGRLLTLPLGPLESNGGSR